MEHIELIPTLFWIIVVALGAPVVLRAFLSLKPCKGKGPVKHFLAPITPNEKRMAMEVEAARMRNNVGGGLGLL